MSLTNYRTLGRSGLAVSPLALGTMTFGTARWGTGEADSRRIFEAYVNAGGNFVDTADVYSGGRSEELLGKFIAERGIRSEMVIATKAGFSSGNGVHSGGNGARHIQASVDASLQRLKTSWLDLFIVHVWDGVTPAEELVQTMATLVRTGKIRYWGISNSPAWYVSRLATLAAAHMLPGPIVMQYFYSLVNRDVEDEHIPLSRDLGLGMMPWSPLAYGLLTGKYNRAVVEAAGPRAGGLPRDAAVDGDARPDDDKRLDGANPFGDSLFTERNWRIVDAVRGVAEQAGVSPATVALQWVVSRTGISSTLIGASRPEQVLNSIASLDFRLTPEQDAALQRASGGERRMLYPLFESPMRRYVTFGGMSVAAWHEQFAS